MRGKWVLATLFWLGALGVVALSHGTLSGSGWGWVAVALAAGLCLAAPSRARAAVLLVATVTVGCLRGCPDPGRIVVRSMDSSGALGPAPLLDRLVDERDAALVGSRLLVMSGALRAPELPMLPVVLDDAYGTLENSTTTFTPIVSALLGLESPMRSTTIVVTAEVETPRLGLISLHGYGGNWVVQCAAVARAVPEAITLCPSMSISGAWWTPDGEAIVKAALLNLEHRGVHRVVLAGLSNGAVGVSRLVPRLEPRIDAAILISGVASAAPVPVVPTLLIQGRTDGLMRTATVLEWARLHAGPTLAVSVLPGTHFVLLEHPELVTEAIRQHLSLVSRRFERPEGRQSDLDRNRTRPR